MFAWGENTKVKVIYNQGAGRVRGYFPILKRPLISQLRKFYIPKESRKKIVGKITHKLQSVGVNRIDFCFTKNTQDAIKEAKSCVDQGYDVILSVGGDGTVNQVINGIVGSRVKLGIIPLGTVNSLALSLGIPLRLDQCLNSLIKGELNTIDLGKANGRYFAACLGVGFDANVVSDIELKRWKKKLGVGSYILSIIKTLIVYKYKKMTVKVEDTGESYDGVGVIINNLKYFAGEFVLTPESGAQSGMLDAVVFKKAGAFFYLKCIWRLCRGTFTQGQDIVFLKAKKMKIISDHECKYHIDGDSSGTVPLDVEVYPRSLQIISPQRPV